MPTLDPADQRVLTTAFKDALSSYYGGGGGGGGAPAGGGAAGGMSEIEKAGTALTGSFKAVGLAGLDVGSKLAQGTARVSDATDALSKNLGKTVKDGGMLGAGLQKVAGLTATLGTHLDENIDTWRNLSKVGLAFGNDIFEMKTQASDARMSIREMSEVLINNNKQLNRLGGTVGQGAKVFSDFAKGFYDSGAGENLRAMGYTTKDLNDTLAAYMTATKMSKLTDEASKKAAIESATAMATEMDAIAKITGKNKEAQLDEMRKRQEDGQIRAGIELAVRQGGEGVRKSFEAMAVSSQRGGKDFERLMQEMFAMGRPSKEMAEKFAMAGGEVQAAMEAANQATKAGNEARARELTQRAADLYAQRAQSNEMLQLAAQGHKGAVEFQSNTRAMNDSLEAIAKANNLDLKNSADLEKARKLQADQVKKDQDTSGKTGGQAVTRSMVDIENRGRDLTKAINDNLTQPLVKDVGPAIAKATEALRGAAGVALIEKEIGEPMKRQRVKSRAPKVVGEEFVGQQMKETDTAYKDVEKLNKLLTGGLSDASAKILNQIAEEESKKTGNRVDAEDIIKKAMQEKGAGVADLVKQLESRYTAADKKIQAFEESGKQLSTATKRSLDKAEGREPTGVVGGVAKGVESLGDLFRTTPGRVTVDNEVTVTSKGPLPIEAGKKASGGFVESPEINLIGEDGPEWVLNKEQMGATLEGAARRGMEQVSKLIPQQKASTGNVDFSQISKTISTSISTVTGGGSKTVQRVQSDDSKKAEKELEILRNQYKEERKALSDKVKADLGPGAKPADIFRTMMDSPEAKALTEKFDQASESLSKRINAGVSYQESIEESKTQTEKTVREQLAIVNGGNVESLLQARKLAKDKKSIDDDWAAQSRKDDAARKAASKKDDDDWRAASKKDDDDWRAASKKDDDDWLDSKRLLGKERQSLNKEEQSAREKENKQTLADAEKFNKFITSSYKKSMNQTEIADAAKKAGVDVGDLYRDMSGNLQSWSNDAAKVLKENEEKSKPIVTTTKTVTEKKVKGSTLEDLKKELPKLEMPKVQGPSLDFKELKNELNNLKLSKLEMPELGTFAKRNLSEDQKKLFDEYLQLNQKESKEKLASIKAEQAQAQYLNSEAVKSRDAIEEKLEAEGKSIKDLTGADKERYDALTKQMNDSFEDVNKARDAQKVLRDAEKTRRQLELQGIDVATLKTKQAEDEKAKIVEDQSNKIKNDIKEALPIDEVTKQSSDLSSTLTDHQKTVLKYATQYTDEQNKIYAESASESLAEQTKQIEEKNAEILKIEKEAEGKTLTERQKTKVAKLKGEIEDHKKSADFRKQEVDAYKIHEEQKLKIAKDVSVRTKEVSSESAKINEENSNKIKNDIKNALPFDEMAGYDTAVAEEQKRKEAEIPKGPAYDDNGNLMPGFSLDENNNPVHVGGDFVEPATKKLAEESRNKKSTPAEPKKFNVGDFSMQNGLFLPTINQAAAGIPAAVKPEEKKPEEKKPSDKKETPKTTVSAKSEEKKPGVVGRSESTLSDVVEQLNQLNKQMAQLIYQHEELGNKQVKATKASGTSNLYQK